MLPACQLGWPNASLTPPPVAPRLTPLFHTVSSVHLPRRRVRVQPGAATGQRMRAGRGEVDVGVPVAAAIGTAVVAGSHGHRHTE
jgi:hypothetical protein